MSKGIVKLSEKRFLIASYVNLLWESLFEICKKTSEDYRVAFVMLRSVARLLPMEVAKRALEVIEWSEKDNEWIEKRAEVLSEEIFEEMEEEKKPPSSFKGERREEWFEYLREEALEEAYKKAKDEAIYFKVLRGLEVISEGLERMNLKWEITTIPIGGESEEGEEALSDAEVHYVEEDSEGLQE